MPRLRTDVLANLLGQGWAVLIGLLFVPYFLGHLGPERFAVITLLPIVVTLMQVMDFGLCVTLNRQLARDAQAAPERARSTALSFCVAHVAIGMAVCAVALSIASTVGPRWLDRPVHLAADEFEHSIVLLAIIASAQWPLPLFQNGLMGLGLQARVNALLGLHATVSNCGAALLIASFEASLTTYLSWLTACACLHALLAGLLFWRALPLAISPVRLDLRALLGHWRFSGGAAGIGITGALLNSADRVIASRLLTLEQFGYYGVATTIGRSLYLLVAPLFSATFPRLSRLAARNEPARLEALYSAASQLMAVAIAPMAAVIFWMGGDVAYAWLGSRSAAEMVGSLAAALALGSLINGIMNLPFAMQLAQGVTHIGLGVNLLLLAVAFVAGSALHAAFGPVGVASTWLVINVVYFVIGVPLTHRAIGLRTACRWAFEDILPPTLASFAAAGLLHFALGAVSTRVGSAALAAATLAASYLGALLVAPIVRREAFALIKGRRTAA